MSKLKSDLDKSTMNRTLLLSVHFHDGWHYGAGSWPPSPARLFQALVSGAVKGGSLTDEDKMALQWLETLETPVIMAPQALKGQAFKNYVPNNDLDAVGNNPKRIPKIRTNKNIRPHIFDSSIPLLFAWTFNSSKSAEHNAQVVCKIAERLYQLGRGVDMAWAYADILNENDIADFIAAGQSLVEHHPSQNGIGKEVLSPQKGSLASLEARFEANRNRFSSVKEKKRTKVSLSLPQKPRFAKAVYDSSPQRFLFEIRAALNEESFVALSCTQSAKLVVDLRNKAVDRLRKTLHGNTDNVDRILIGRGAKETDKSSRVRIIPIPSIGHKYADHAIRRVLVEVPPNCPLRADDIEWAFSGIERINPTTGEIVWNLVYTQELGMLNHYGVDHNGQNGFQTWYTITPAALPMIRKGGRITGTMRLEYERNLAQAVMQTLRHTGIATSADSIRTQREPFDRNGVRAERFAMSERFSKRVLYHVEIVFEKPLLGTLVIGNGRYLGLGLMAPKTDIW